MADTNGDIERTDLLMTDTHDADTKIQEISHNRDTKLLNFNEHMK